jgi:hypothetical protein
VEGEFSRQRLLLGVDVMVVLGLELDRWHVPGGAVQAVVLNQSTQFSRTTTS